MFTTASVPPSSSPSSVTLDPTPSTSVSRMTGPCLREVPSNAAAGHGTRLPDPGSETDDVLPPNDLRSAPTNVMSTLFGSFMQFMNTQNPELFANFWAASGSAIATESGVPSSVTPSTPPPPSQSVLGGGVSSVSFSAPSHLLFTRLGRVSSLAPSAVDRRPRPLAPAPASTPGEVPFRRPFGQHPPSRQFMPHESHFVPLYAASAPSTSALGGAARCYPYAPSPYGYPSPYAPPSWDNQSSLAYELPAQWTIGVFR